MNDDKKVLISIILCGLPVLINIVFTLFSLGISEKITFELMGSSSVTIFFRIFILLAIITEVYKGSKIAKWVMVVYLIVAIFSCLTAIVFLIIVDVKGVIFLATFLNAVLYSISLFLLISAKNYKGRKIKENLL